MSGREDLVRGGLAAPVLDQPAQIAAAYQSRVGALLAAALAPGATTVTVDDVDDFVEDGGQLAVESADDLYVAATADTPAYTDRPGVAGIRYTKVNRDTNVLTLAVPWDAGFPTFAAGDSVWVDPPSVDRLADVALDGDPGQVVTARIPYALQTAIPEGLRIEGEGEWVQVGLTDLGDGYVVIDVLGEPPVFDPTVESDPAASDVTFDTITADVVESPSVAKRNEETLTLYVDPNAGSAASDENGGEALAPLLDLFERTAAGNAWGTSDSGHVWSSLQHQGNISDVTGGSARYRENGASLNSVQRSTFAPLDVEVLTTLNFSSMPTGGSSYYGVNARTVDANNLLAVAVNLQPTELRLYISTRIGGTWADIANLNSVFTGLTAGTVGASDYKLRAQFVTNPEGGTDVRGKLWRADLPEPDDWMLEVNTTVGGGTQSAAGVGAHARTGGGYTATTHPIAAYRDYLAQCVVDGQPVDVTQGGVGPLRTIAGALARVGEVNDGAVTILLGSGGIDEDVYVSGLTGGGSVTIDGAGTAIVYGSFYIRGIAHYITLTNFTLQDMAAPGLTGTIDVRQGGFVYCNNLLIQTNGARGSNISFNYGATGRVDNCQLNGSSVRCLYAANCSTVYASNNLGTGAGTCYQATCATIFVNGTRPTDANSQTLGGQIFGTATTGAGTPPPTSTKKTITVTANATHTWRPEWGWRAASEDEAYQGEWQGSGGLSRGCMFAGTKLRVSGKTADSGKVYIKRLSSGGSSGAEDVFLATHPQTSQPGGSPGLTLGPTRVGSLKWGEGKWFDIPKSWVQSLMDGPSRGLMIYHGSASPYIICAGRKASAGNFKVTITYH